MATSENWYTIDFKAFSDSAWTGIAAGEFPALPGRVAAAIIADTSLLLYVIAVDGEGNLRLIGENVGEFVVPSATIAAETLATKFDTTLSDGAGWCSVRGGDGAWLFYDNVTGTVRKLSDPDALAGFLA